MLLTQGANAETGVASYYHTSFEGKRTASGRFFHNDEMTAAHKTLPFGTKVRVENLNNGLTVDVVITDRGPFVRGRIIDLTVKAAKALDFWKAGTAPVRVTVQ